ncbi:hypothetical protein J2S54_006838 [Streptomyces sp. DSM 42143]|uniref:RICIN domain-containing protein n=1 Tax=Streptomyces TaxID=1883 RepID=UPI0015C7CD66|nr:MULTISPECIES: RICIN domain-containing protein [unclassified Streptomyces]MDN3248572.1 RICIN domain-containing protein [Streptomyces sp. ZSW22]MDN3256109.1 RICIN domain-containing protein [Streptomyces sp. MA25(2023)]MDQ0390018.1 hypothetical protein [Streptomyces sp. DSM 42143]
MHRRTLLSTLGAGALMVTAGLAGSAPAAADAPRAAAGPQFRITSQETGAWAKNFPAPGEQATSLVVLDDQFASIFERWTIRPHEGQYTIQNAATGHWATAEKNGQVVGSSELNGTNADWRIERAGAEGFTIGRAGDDLVWTASEDHIELKPADGSNAQRWSFLAVN